METPTPSEPAKQAGPTEEPISPVNEPGLANEATPPEPDPDPADGASAGTPAADGDPEAKADAPVPAEPSSPPKDDNTKASADTGRSETKKTPKRTGTKSTSGSKPKWDPDSPVPF